jgi:hypothetical protein
MRPSERAGAMIDRPAGRRQGITSTDRGWTWQEESAVAFAGGDYEIRIKGRLSDRLLAAFEGLTTTVQPVETVLHGPVQDPGGALRPAGPDPVAGPGVGELRQLPASADEVPAEPEPHRQIRSLGRPLT